MQRRQQAEQRARQRDEEIKRARDEAKSRAQQEEQDRMKEREHRRTEREQQEKERRAYIEREETEALKRREAANKQQQEREEQLRKARQEREDARAKLHETMRNQTKFGHTRDDYQERVRSEFKFSTGASFGDAHRDARSRFASATRDAWSTPSVNIYSEKAWAAFEEKSQDGQIGMGDVPFPDGAMFRVGNKDFKKLAMRWHPDKFLQKFGSKLRPDQKEEIIEKVKATFQKVNAAR